MSYNGLAFIFCRKVSQSARQYRYGLFLNNAKREAKKLSYAYVCVTGHF